MDIQITSQEINPGGTSHVTATAGKVSAYVGKYGAYMINVTAQNASHKVWRGSGRIFSSWENAAAAYKSAEMKAIIATARDILDPAPAGEKIDPLIQAVLDTF